LATLEPLKLHALGGAAAPPDLGDDLRCILRMPPAALGKFWQALGPCLEDKLSKETEQLLDMFCTGYQIADADLARAIKGCRFLILSAVRLDTSPDQLADDLDALCPEAPVIKEVILAGYAPLKAQMRRVMMSAALADHGKLMVGVKWRLDTVEASERGVKLRVPVAILTLHYREAGGAGQITMQILPDMMGELKAICDQFVS
jgi:hypothetical protein